jgi:hypothetical protein
MHMHRHVVVTLVWKIILYNCAKGFRAESMLLANANIYNIYIHIYIYQYIYIYIYISIHISIYIYIYIHIYVT